jgi:glutamate/tyrosine decarboxylase-like PLP-dependent enzyme
VFAVVATAGTTNAGLVDELASIAPVAEEHALWFHVDAAYGGAALFAPSVRHHFDGIEAADSMVVDPHKWLFAPFDSCALLYRAPAVARAAHAQHASYLDPMRSDEDGAHAREAWNPADYAYHLSRRARGLPFWFSRAVHGTDAYRAAVEPVLAIARAAAARVDSASQVELVRQPELSVVLFRRPGWADADYARWARTLLEEQTAFVLPTKHRGETVGRAAFLHPLTTVAVFDEVLAAMR